jgi:hypothetical protein
VPSRRGYIPADLSRRLDHTTPHFFERKMAAFLAHQLGGVDASSIDDGQRDELALHYGLERPELDHLLGLLDQVGCGNRPPKPRRRRDHGRRLEDRCGGLVGRLPRALALRMPTTADTHRVGPIDGEDVWGPVRCSHTLRAAHLALVAAVCGLARLPGRRRGDQVLCTAGELAFLLQGKRRRSGADLAWIYGLLADHDQLDLEADVRPNRANQEPSEAHRIPSAPIVGVRRQLDGELVSLPEYAERIGPDGHGSGRCGQEATIAITLARWVWRALDDEQRRPVLIDFTVWSHLAPLGKRLYPLLQGLGRSAIDDSLYFYLGPQRLFTLGLRGRRLDQAAAMVRHALTTLYHADQRYEGFGEGKHAGTRYPSFAVKSRRGVRSMPTALARTHRAPPRRPRVLRSLPPRRHVQLGRVRRDELAPEALRRLGVEEARRQATEIRRTILAAYRPVPRAGLAVARTDLHCDQLAARRDQRRSRAGPSP